mmetsp:Transcript_28289/g.42240  ORF Transcript_28289/g.42240 Transcript_28289/m.42240 type:complete len:341 (+) Transcript_28289:766-1788(+)
MVVGIREGRICPRTHLLQVEEKRNIVTTSNNIIWIENVDTQTQMITILRHCHSSHHQPVDKLIGKVPKEPETIIHNPEKRKMNRVPIIKILTMKQTTIVGTTIVTRRKVIIVLSMAIGITIVIDSKNSLEERFIEATIIIVVTMMIRKIVTALFHVTIIGMRIIIEEEMEILNEHDFMILSTTTPTVVVVAAAAGGKVVVQVLPETVIGVIILIIINLHLLPLAALMVEMKDTQLPIVMVRIIDAILPLIRMVMIVMAVVTGLAMDDVKMTTMIEQGNNHNSISNTRRKISEETIVEMKKTIIVVTDMWIIMYKIALTLLGSMVMILVLIMVKTITVMEM